MTRFGVVRFPGSCDELDALAACERVGEAELLWHGDRSLHGVDVVVIPGGFSYGDYLRVGAIARFSPLMESVIGFAREGGPVLGICNGFQVLCEAGLLPGALLPNRSLRFVCRQVTIEVVDTDTAFTRACARGEGRSPVHGRPDGGSRHQECGPDARTGTLLSIPVKHTTGRYFSPEPVRVVFRYAGGVNPNGSQEDIAGVANDAGNVVGLMPHPEHAVDLLHGSQDGLKLFASAAEALVAG